MKNDGFKKAIENRNRRVKLKKKKYKKDPLPKLQSFRWLHGDACNRFQLTNSTDPASSLIKNTHVQNVEGEMHLSVADISNFSKSDHCPEGGQPENAQHVEKAVHRRKVRHLKFTKQKCLSQEFRILSH